MRREVKYTGTVYVIAALETPYVKIGRSLLSGSAYRLATLQVGCPFKLQLLYEGRVADAVKTERKLHEKYRSYHHRGEWYHLSSESLTDLLDDLTTIDHHHTKEPDYVCHTSPSEVLRKFQQSGCPLRLKSAPRTPYSLCGTPTSTLPQHAYDLVRLHKPAMCALLASANIDYLLRKSSEVIGKVVFQKVFFSNDVPKVGK